MVMAGLDRPCLRQHQAEGLAAYLALQGGTPVVIGLGRFALGHTCDVAATSIVPPSQLGLLLFTGAPKVRSLFICLYVGRHMKVLPRRYAFLEEPGIRRFVIETEALYPADAVNFSIDEQRAFYDRLCSHFRRPRPFGVEIEDRSVLGPLGPVPIRIYRRSREIDRAMLLYLHGGGFMLGGLDSHDDICAEICDRARVGVVAVGYRLAPEHRFPAAFDDCLAAFYAVA